jgi:hypothetical protein
MYVVQAMLKLEPSLGLNKYWATVEFVGEERIAFKIVVEFGIETT